MKQRSKLWNYVTIGLLAVLSIAWGLFFSDYGTTGSLPKNDTITNDTIIFAAIVFFLIISGRACTRLNRITCVYNDFQAAVEKLRSWEAAGETQCQYSELEACFTDEKNRRSFQNYRAECDRLRRSMPNGCECDIADYFNESALEDYLSIDALNQYPGLYTGIGMLGTFIGLTLGLENFNFLGSSWEISQNIESLMSCIRLAFITSIMGLALSFAFNAQYRWLARDTFEGLDNFVSEYRRQTSNANHNGLNRIIENQSGQTEAIRMLSDEIALSVSELLSVQLSKMEGTYLEACKLLEEAQIKGMEVLVDKFTEKLLGTLTSGIENLSQAIEDTCDYQKDATERIKQNVEAISSLTDKTVEIQKISQDTVVKLKEYTGSLDENTNKMLDQVRKNNDSMVRASSIFERMGDLTRQVIGAADELRKFADSMNDAVDDVEGVYKDHIKKLAEVSESMIAGFDRQRSDFFRESEQQRAELKQYGNDAAEQISSSVDAYKAATDRLKTSVAEHVEQAVLGIRTENSTISREMGTTLHECTRQMREYTETVGKASAQMDRSVEGLRQMAQEVPEKVADELGAKTERLMRELGTLQDTLQDLSARAVSEEQTAAEQSAENQDSDEAVQ